MREIAESHWNVTLQIHSINNKGAEQGQLGYFRGHAARETVTANG